MSDASALLSDPAQLAQGVAVLMLLVARMAPLGLLVPWLAPRPGAPVMGLLLTVVMAVVLWPVASASAAPLPGSLLALFAVAFREALIGAVYALSLALPLLSLRWAGAFIERSRGVATGEHEAGALAELLLWLGIVAFFALGGHRLAIAALAGAITSHPVGVLAGVADAGQLALGSARLVGEAFAAALLVALPVLAALLIAELALGLSLRLSGALPLAALLPGGRAALGLTVVWVSVAFVLHRLPEAFEQSLVAAARLWRTL